MASKITVNTLFPFRGLIVGRTSIGPERGVAWDARRVLPPDLGLGFGLGWVDAERSGDEEPLLRVDGHAPELGGEVVAEGQAGRFGRQGREPCFLGRAVFVVGDVAEIVERVDQLEEAFSHFLASVERLEVEGDTGIWHSDLTVGGGAGKGIVERTQYCTRHGGAPDWSRVGAVAVHDMCQKALFAGAITTERPQSYGFT